MRSAAFGTSRTFVRWPISNCTFAVRYRQKPAAGVVCDYFHGIGNHILCHGGIETYFPHLAVEYLPGIGIHGKSYRWPG